MMFQALVVHSSPLNLADIEVTSWKRNEEDVFTRMVTACGKELTYIIISREGSGLRLGKNYLTRHPRITLTSVTVTCRRTWSV